MTRSRFRRLCGTGIAAIPVIAVALVLYANREPDYSTIPVATLADLERELGTLREGLGIPGLSAAIAIEGRIVWAHGFGWANLERHVRVDPDKTSFHLASVTKPYAATVALQLADEGRLHLDAPVSDFGIDMPRREPVRVWHLLSHTSLVLKIPRERVTFVALANSDGLSRRRRLGDHGNVLVSPAATLFLNWYLNGKRP